MKNVLFLILPILLFVSCDKEERQAQKDEDIIRSYVEDNNLTATRHESGMYYIIEKEGSGGHPDLNSRVTVRYHGYFLDGSLFDETMGTNSVKFDLSTLISGWQIAIPMLQKGGKGTFILPSALAYGSDQVGSIPPNSVLLFEIELVDFN